MGHIPEDDNLDEFMNASAEEWSKPEEAPETPEIPAPEYEHDRWGSPLPEEPPLKDVEPFGSEAFTPSTPYEAPPKKKAKAKWWVIAIIILVVLCICICVGVLVGLPLFGVNLIENMPLEYNGW